MEADRAVTVARRLLGLLCLASAVLFLGELSYFFTEAGPTPRSALLRSVPASNWGLSVHMVNDSPFYLAGLFALQAAAAVALVRGRRPALAAAVAWFLVLSAHHRAPFLLGPSLQLLAQGLLWCAFLPAPALVLQVCASGWLTGYLRLPPDSLLIWVAYLGPILILIPARLARLLGVAALACVYVWELFGSGDPFFALVCLAMLPAALSAPSWSALSRPAGALVGVLGFLSVVSSLGLLFGFPVGRLPVYAQALGLEQVWMDEGVLATPKTYFTLGEGVPEEFVDGPPWRSVLHAPFLRALNNASQVPLQRAYFAYVGQTLTQWGRTGQTRRIEVCTQEGSDRQVIAAWTLPAWAEREPYPLRPRRHHKRHRAAKDSE